MSQILFRQYSEAPQIGCAFVNHLMIQMQTMILNQKLIVNHYQILILIVIDSLKLTRMSTLIWMLTPTRMLILIQTLIQILNLKLNRMLKLTRMSTLIQTLI